MGEKSPLLISDTDGGESHDQERDSIDIPVIEQQRQRRNPRTPIAVTAEIELHRVDSFDDSNASLLDTQSVVSSAAGLEDDDEVATESYLSQNIWRLCALRGGWLLFFFIGLLACTAVMNNFDEVLDRHVELAYFVPLVLGHGGNSGSQTCSTVIRAIALNEIRVKGDNCTPTRDLVQVVIKEVVTGLLLGLSLGLTIYLTAALIGKGRDMSFCVMCTLPLVSAWSNFIGVLLPVGVAKINQDPAVLAAPLTTTLTDATGLLIYFFTAEALLGDLHA